MFKQSDAVIEHAGGDRAYYDLRRDRIELPFPASQTTSESKELLIIVRPLGSR